MSSAEISSTEMSSMENISVGAKIRISVLILFWISIRFRQLNFIGFKFFNSTPQTQNFSNFYHIQCRGQTVFIWSWIYFPVPRQNICDWLLYDFMTFSALLQPTHWTQGLHFDLEFASFRGHIFIKWELSLNHLNRYAHT